MKKKSQESFFYNSGLFNKFAFNTIFCSNILLVSLFALGEFIVVANENKRSTGAEDGKGVLYFKNIFLVMGYAFRDV